jgi:hypothetical protein
MIQASVKRVLFIGISSVILPRKFHFRIALLSGDYHTAAQRLTAGVASAIEWHPDQSLVLSNQAFLSGGHSRQ